MNEKYYFLTLWDYGTPAFVSCDKMYVGTETEIRAAIEAMKKMGGLSSILSMLPGMGMGGKLKIKPEDLDERRIEKVKAIILSMTPKERRDPSILNSSRKQRIAKGAGTDVVEVNKLLKQYDQTKLMMKQMKNNKMFRF